ncbi:MAG: fluoride efflux transporter CrcB [Chloroflexi bacterium]|nr:fluoride efflux transporter CrcB [Chloroflexota bacterium]
MEKLFYITIAGALGTLARYFIGNLFVRDGINTINFGIFIPNILGSLAFGFIWSISYDKGLISDQLRVPILVGFMGAFTTFSTFAFDNFTLLRDSQWSMLSLNLLITNIGGVIFVYLGFRIAKFF